MLEDDAGSLRRGGSTPYEVDWAAVQACTSDCQTLEQAIGRGVFDGIGGTDPWPSSDSHDPFFGFSVADVAADFGDESRYRERVVKKVTGILGTRRKVVAT
jgi:hypothetical protein